MSDTVRVLRILEYIGPREAVEKLLKKSIQAEHEIQRTKVTIRASTLGMFPEIMKGTDHHSTCMCVECLPSPKEVTNASSEQDESYTIEDYNPNQDR